MHRIHVFFEEMCGAQAKQLAAELTERGYKAEAISLPTYRIAPASLHVYVTLDGKGKVEDGVLHIDRTTCEDAKLAADKVVALLTDSV